eukprot:5208693-Pyramimonas_sp.AAC.1
MAFQRGLTWASGSVVVAEAVVFVVVGVVVVVVVVDAVVAVVRGAVIVFLMGLAPCFSYKGKLGVTPKWAGATPNEHTWACRLCHAQGSGDETR